MVNHKTGDRCHLKFAPYSYFSRDVPRKVGFSIVLFFFFFFYSIALAGCKARADVCINGKMYITNIEVM